MNRTWNSPALAALAAALLVPAGAAALGLPVELPLIQGTWYIDNTFPLRATAGVPATIEPAGTPSPEGTARWTYEVSSPHGPNYHCNYVPARHTGNVGDGRIHVPVVESTPLVGQCTMDVPPAGTLFEDMVFARFWAQGECDYGSDNLLTTLLGCDAFADGRPTTQELGLFFRNPTATVTVPLDALTGLGAMYWDAKLLGRELPPNPALPPDALTVPFRVAEKSVVAFDLERAEWIAKSGRGELHCYDGRAFFYPYTVAYWPLAGSCGSFSEKVGEGNRLVHLWADYAVGFQPVSDDLLVSYLGVCGSFLITGQGSYSPDAIHWLGQAFPLISKPPDRILPQVEVRAISVLEAFATNSTGDYCDEAGSV